MLGAVCRRVVPASLAVLAAVTGCSRDGEDPRPVSGAPRQVAAAVMELDRATRARDYRTICEELLTGAARRRAGGRDCARLLRSATAGVRRPRIELTAIQVRGERADARVRTRAQGQPPLVDTIRLVREDGRYRIEALAG